MGIQKNGINVSCESCRFMGSHEDGSFDVSVPVMAEGRQVMVRLHCDTTSGKHRLRVGELETGDAPLSQDASDKLSATLDHLAEKGVCGNGRLCPSEVAACFKKTES